MRELNKQKIKSRNKYKNLLEIEKKNLTKEEVELYLFLVLPFSVNYSLGLGVFKYEFNYAHRQLKQS